MKNYSLNEIRSSFINYFKDKGHEVVKSSSLVPNNDPTLLFTNCGMVQFKNVFTGLETRPYNKAVTSQKSVRAGGKHNDLDNVGFTARHHTFFEMLGNFSFGDYFKEDAIANAWDFLTNVCEVPKEKLLVTIYHDDDEAYDLWKKIANLPDEKIIRIATDDNFWRMGDTGPCGPCSEIFYDHGDHIFGDVPGTPDEDGDRFVEIWNLVFMQYDQQTPEKRVPLPNKCIDTGSGIERLAAVLQGTHDNYEIDLFKDLIAASAKFSNTEPDGEHAVSHRIITDHLRSSAFLIADGVTPSNEGRGYVLRRIMRRAMRHAHIIGCAEPLMYKLVPSLIKQMGNHYSELVEREGLIIDTLRSEEQRFKQTLERGLKLLKDETSKLSENENLSGEIAFKLFDTYGFPLDLTQDVLKSENRDVDIDGFNKAMEEQKALARKSWSGSGDTGTDKLWFELDAELSATEFMGYAITETEAEITAIIKDGVKVENAKTGDEIMIIANQSPFYAESGGQVGDRGFITSTNGLKIEITDTQKKLDKLFIHIGKIISGDLNKGDIALFKIDDERRKDIRANHSATHLLHASLRYYLGDHVAQKGSLVDENRLRFDFSQNNDISLDEITNIEKDINKRIRDNTKVSTRLLPIEEAQKIGAMSLFGEKYGDEVRVLSMGALDENDKEYSIELCGGTHVNHTGDIGLFKITSVSSIAANIKRVEAVTGRKALEYIQNRDLVLNQLSANLSTPADELENRVSGLLSERKSLEKEIDNLKNKIAIGDVGSAEQDNSKEINGVKFIHRVMQDTPAKNMRSIADELKKKNPSSIIALIAVNDGKAAIVVSVTDNLTESYNAVNLAKLGVSSLGGKGGGGRPDFAQGGGPDGDNVDEAIKIIEKEISNS